MRRLAAAAAAAAVLSLPGRVGGEADAALSDAAGCAAGTYQHDPVVLGCGGGRSRQTLVLTPHGTAHSTFHWVVPKGTRDFRFEVVFEPLPGDPGADSGAPPPADARLAARCIGGGAAPLLASEGGVLSRDHTTADAAGARWAWSGDPAAASVGGHPFKEWLRVEGVVDCDVSFMLANAHKAQLAVDLKYRWSGVSPCPEVPLGCRQCPQGVCQSDERAVCNGSRYWSCQPVGGEAHAAHAAPAAEPARPAEAPAHPLDGASRVYRGAPEIPIQMDIPADVLAQAEAEASAAARAAEATPTPWGARGAVAGPGATDVRRWRRDEPDAGEVTVKSTVRAMMLGFAALAVMVLVALMAIVTAGSCTPPDPRHCAERPDVLSDRGPGYSLEMGDEEQAPLQPKS